MGSWCVVSSSKGQTKVGGGRVVFQSRQAPVAAWEGWYNEWVESSRWVLVMVVMEILVVYELVTETVAVKSSGYQLVMVVLVVHDGGW